ncbi:MAG: SDR family NAD(P)-dependent oxidoreductase [Phycisphaerae bacterium]|nr:SDR family NAD(P)-dependent oxidoreductase [Phycisphaerae bacterium]
MTESDTQKLVRLIGPALRGLWGDETALATVCFEPGDADGADVAFQPPAGGEIAETVAALRETLDRAGRQAGSVGVTGAGVFRRLPKPDAAAGRVGARVAFVTGAAQGFGLEIAQHLAAEGAAVVLGDVNADGARAAAEAICEAHGPDRALAVAMDVADADSVDAAVGAAVAAYGGFDVFIANAGVLKAGGLDDLAERDFDFVTGVNYKGYYLCVRAAAPVLAAQHAARPQRWGDIIQINSKSGLAGSRRNFAYAGGKFGGVGLTQSFALELVADGIKVNAVCPGNFFDGPLWSDPDHGLFVQYLRTGKVPGAETVADVRRAYEAKVPMQRGCAAEDVMKAIYYVLEQDYETGQAIPVTGGQVMLH